MSRELRILHLADSHIGADLPGRPRTQRRRRGDDLIDSYRAALDQALIREVDLVIHAGDVFDLPNPNNAALTAASAPLLRVAAAGVPVVIVPGNHERSALPDFLLFSHPNLHIVREPITLTFDLRGRRVAVASFPCIRRQSGHLFEGTLESTGWRAAKAEVNILAVHQTFESATCGPVGYRFRSGDDVIERDLIPAEFDYVAAGHIHRHQVLETPRENGPPIVYAGSPDRICFAERDESKGFELIECNGHGLAHRFIEHEVRPMRLIPLDISGFSRPQILDAVFERIRELPSGAIVSLRLSGETTRRAMSGLKLAQRLRTERPDLRLNISVQAVEFIPERQAARGAAARSKSAFADLDAAPLGLIALDVDERKSLPAEYGTYAFFDASGRVLYVGKAKNVRARVRSHMSQKGGAERFAGWTRQIARVEVRRAYSELEALLVEAELIRTLRPPFNRQMRHWSRYCYLCENGRPHGRLQVCTDAVDDRPCFGPFRSRGGAKMVIEAAAALFQTADCPEENASGGGVLRGSHGPALCRRYYDGHCSGPCADRIDSEAYAAILRRRDALLAGIDDAALVEWEQEQEEQQTDEPDDAIRLRIRRLQTLRGVFDFAGVLRNAGALLDGVIWAPGPDDASRTLIQIAPAGLRLKVVRHDDQGTRIAEAMRGSLQMNEAAQIDQNIPKTIVDSLCTAYREMRRSPEMYCFVSA